MPRLLLAFAAELGLVYLTGGSHQRDSIVQAAKHVTRTLFDQFVGTVPPPLCRLGLSDPCSVTTPLGCIISLELLVDFLHLLLRRF